MYRAPTPALSLLRGRTVEITAVSATSRRMCSIRIAIRSSLFCRIFLSSRGLLIREENARRSPACLNSASPFRRHFANARTIGGASRVNCVALRRPRATRWEPTFLFRFFFLSPSHAVGNSGSTRSHGK